MLHQRQKFLYNTIGYFEEERLSFVYSIILLSASFGFMVLGNALSWLFFNFYNEKFHPFQQILDTSNGEIMQYTQSVLQATIIRNDFETSQYLRKIKQLTSFLVKN